MHASDLKIIFGSKLKVEEPPDISKIFTEIIDKSGIVGKRIYGAKYHDSYKKRRLCEYVFSQNPDFRKMKRYVEILFPESLMVGKKNIKRDKYNMGEYIVIRDIVTKEEMGFIGLDVEYIKADEKIDGISKYLRTITGYYITPGMCLSKSAKNKIVIDYHLEQIKTLSSLIEKHSELITATSEDFDGSKNECEYIYNVSRSFLEFADLNMFKTTTIDDLNLSNDIIETLKQKGFNTIDEAIRNHRELPYDVWSVIKKYVPGRVYECITNHIINSCICE